MNEANSQNTNEMSEPTHGPGRPTKYSEQTITRICDALADGMPIKSACAVAGVGLSTLSDWRKADPELEARIDAAKEKLRQKCLQTFAKALDDNDWRAADALMKLVFPEYRQNAKVEVNANATASTGNTLIDRITPEQIEELQALRKRALEETRK